MTIGSQSGAYRIDALLGRGGMAEVYKAWNTGLHRYEALKVLPPQMTYDKSFVERFLSEARMAAGLHHPHIATIHAVSAPDASQPYFAMELVEGEDLADLLRRRVRLPLPEALVILEQIAEALDYAHQRGVVHRDVKPANVLLQPAGSGSWNVKVVDFGIARAQEAGDGARLTKTGMIVGTPEYMSPEQGGSGEKVESRSDQYSLAVVAYEMLCGQPPFRVRDDMSPISVIIAHQRDVPAPPVDRVPGLPEHVNKAILKALAKRPHERWASCHDFVDGCSGMGDIHRSLRPVKRQGFFIPAALIGIIVLGLGLVAFGLSRGSNNPPAETTNSDPVSSSNGVASVPTPPPTAIAPEIQTSPVAENNGPSATSSEPAQWKSWRGNGFVLDYPSNWMIGQTTTPDGPRVKFIAPEPNTVALVDVSVTGRTSSPLADWQDMDRRLQKKHGSNYHLISLVPSRLDGNSAAVWVFTLIPKGQPPLLKKTDIGVTHGRIGYALLLSAPADSFDARRDQFAHMQASFHLVGP